MLIRSPFKQHLGISPHHVDNANYCEKCDRFFSSPREREAVGILILFTDRFILTCFHLFSVPLLA